MYKCVEARLKYSPLNNLNSLLNLPFTTSTTHRHNVTCLVLFSFIVVNCVSAGRIFSGL